jgi:tRNA(Ile)-lysidine synthase
VSDLLKRVGNTIQQRQLLKRGGKILVAVSGGLDSMALLHSLHALSARYRWKLAVAHFNHQLRGRSSDADESLVRKTAAAMGLPAVVGRADVKRFAGKSKLSIEMAARRLRHEFFVRAAKKRGIRTVVLAHHADEQVELFFLRLLRGAGGEGLAGMKWSAPSPVDRSITLVRPLLDVTKAELREFAHSNGFRFREDASNTLLAAPRNRIRHELLPLLHKKYQPGLAKTVLRLMEIAGAEAEFIGETAQQWLEKLKVAPRPGPHPVRRGKGGPGKAGPGKGGDFENLPVAVQRKVLQFQLAETGVVSDFGLVEQLREVPGRFVSVGPNLSAARDEAGRIELRSPLAPEFSASELKLKLQGRSGQMGFGGLKFCWAMRSFSGLRGRSPHQTEFFDADNIGGQITLRYWRPGDRFQPIGSKSAVKLQDWFVNQKVPRVRRHELVVAAAESGEIFWIEGLRIGEHFKLTPRTQRRLIWRWHRVEVRGRQ